MSCFTDCVENVRYNGMVPEVGEPWRDIIPFHGTRHEQSWSCQSNNNSTITSYRHSHCLRRSSV